MHRIFRPTVCLRGSSQTLKPMIATILAAGAASRLRPLTDTQPKCLLKVGQRSLLGRTVDALYSVGIEEIIVVAGYHSGMVITFLKNNYPNLNIHIIENNDYEHTGSLYSLWTTRDYTAGQEFLLFDCDVLFDPAILRRLTDESDTVIAVNSNNHDEEKMKMVTGSDGIVTEINKTCDRAEAAGLAVGIEKIDADYSKAMFKEIDHMVNKERLHEAYYQLAFERLIHKGFRMRAIDTSDLYSTSIDTREDFKKAQETIPEELF